MCFKVLKIFFLLFHFILNFTSGRILSSSDFNLYNDNDISDGNEGFQRCQPSRYPLSAGSNCCGIDTTITNRIVGGVPTLINQYPWLALIEYEINWNKNLIALKCGGSLISGKFVLTAAHCVTGDILENSSPVNVILGDYDKFHYGPDCVNGPSGSRMCSRGETRIAIQRTVPHEKYVAKTNAHDIALIELKKMAPFNDAIRPICLPDYDLTLAEHRNLWFTVAGWGTMKQEKDGKKFKGTSSNVKRHLMVPYVPLKKCQRTWATATSNNICAGGLKGEDACMGDSGGPLMHQRDGQYELIGAVSFGAGEPCGTDGIPGVYINVYKYKTWIWNVIGGRRSRFYFY